MERVRVSAIIPARNAVDTVGECVTALAAGTRPPDEILVVDDGSTDDTAAVAAEAGAEVLSVGHAGPGRARTAGARRATGTILVFTDADCVAEPEFVARLVAPVAEGRAVAAKGAYTTAQRGLVPRFIQVEFEERYRRLERVDVIDFADGYAAAYQRAAFDAAGGFDLSLRLSQNVDLAYRLSEAGETIVFVPDARTRHRHPAGVGAYMAAKLERSYWRGRSLWAHPGKAVRDAYTPWSLKAQMGLVAVGGVVALVGAVGLLAAGVTARLLVVDAAAFVASAVPFLSLAAKSDPAVALVGLPLLVARAAALVLGTGAGLAAGAAGRGRTAPARAT